MNDKSLPARVYLGHTLLPAWSGTEDPHPPGSLQRERGLLAQEGVP